MGAQQALKAEQVARKRAEAEKRAAQQALKAEKVSMQEALQAEELVKERSVKMEQQSARQAGNKAVRHGKVEQRKNIAVQSRLLKAHARRVAKAKAGAPVTVDKELAMVEASSGAQGRASLCTALCPRPLK